MGKVFAVGKWLLNPPQRLEFGLVTSTRTKANGCPVKNARAM